MRSLGAIVERLRAAICKFSKRVDDRGNIAVITALISPIFIATMGLAGEGSYWYSLQRGMQNAADAAVMAAATNGTSSYATEAQAVAAQMGYQNGVNNVVVTASNSAACPSGGDSCFSVSVSEVVPLYMAQVAGYKGDTTLNGSPAVTINVTSLATQGTTQRNYCLLALGTSGNAIRGNGVPSTNFAGCNIMSNASALCNGHNMGATYGDAHLSDNGCGAGQDSGLPIVADPYAALASSIPANTCSSYPQEPGKNGTPLPVNNQW